MYMKQTVIHLHVGCHSYNLKADISEDWIIIDYGYTKLKCVLWGHRASLDLKYIRSSRYYTYPPSFSFPDGNRSWSGIRGASYDGTGRVISMPLDHKIDGTSTGHSPRLAIG